MPTENHAKVRKLLKDGKAKVVKRCPFTIQLLYDSTHYVQSVSLGIDAGSSLTIKGIKPLQNNEQFNAIIKLNIKGKQQNFCKVND